eukprot:TRINITY_DN43862_c0_g1_i1.p1 TRINITY_DN43862_c0_g1~~TRINITY_DN43862_c0_g1_i1.p1  ORF type:complete len:554 (+),score=143.32 TRINITY_DN43862_c0_g1_i1:77-1663(+)
MSAGGVPANPNEGLFSTPWKEETLPPLPLGRWRVVAAAGLLVRRGESVNSEERGRAPAGALVCVVEVRERRGRVSAAPTHPTGWVSLYGGDGKQLAEPAEGQAAPGRYPQVLLQRGVHAITAGSTHTVCRGPAARRGQRRAEQGSAAGATPRGALERSSTTSAPPRAPPASSPVPLLTPAQRPPRPQHGGATPTQPTAPRPTSPPRHPAPAANAPVISSAESATPSMLRAVWQPPATGGKRPSSICNGLFAAETSLSHGDPYVAEPWVRAQLRSPSAQQLSRSASPSPRRVDTPERRRWMRLLRNFFLRNDPRRLGEVSSLQRRYAGREPVLMKTLQRHYGVSGASWLAAVQPVEPLRDSAHDAQVRLTPGTEHVRTPDTAGHPRRPTGDCGVRLDYGDDATALAPVPSRGSSVQWSPRGTTRVVALPRAVAAATLRRFFADWMRAPARHRTQRVPPGRPPSHGVSRSSPVGSSRMAARARRGEVWPFAPQHGHRGHSDPASQGQRTGDTSDSATDVTESSSEEGGGA